MPAFSQFPGNFSRQALLPVLADLVQAVQWLKEHDHEAKAMIQKASAFVHEKLNRAARLCYLQHLLHDVGALTRYVPVPCAERAVCVPLLRQLSFMGHYVDMSRSIKCGVHQQLDQMYNRSLDHGKKIGKRWGDTDGLSPGH